MTTYYVDPLAGSSANNGLSSGTPFGSYFDCFNGALVGGLTNGDVVYLMASTVDNYPDQNFNFGLSGYDFGSTGGIVRVIGVNPSTLLEDGTKYVMSGRDNQYSPRFGNSNHSGFVYKNCVIVGKWHTYTGAGKSAYVNCWFTDAYGGITHTSASTPFYEDNSDNLFRDCRFFSTGSSPNYSSASSRDGNVYGGDARFESCSFFNFSDFALLNQRDSNITDCRFKDCGGAAQFEYRSNRGSHHVFNCIIDNTTDDAFQQDELTSGRYDHPKPVRFYGNLFNNIGGYMFYYREPLATEVNYWVPSDVGGIGQREADGNIDWEGNIYQNVTNGVHSLPFNQAVIDRGWHATAGYTSASFGLTYDADGFGLMLGTGDDIVFNFSPGNSAGLGIFLHSFTEAVVSGSVPEFGDVF